VSRVSRVSRGNYPKRGGHVGKGEGRDAKVHPLETVIITILPIRRTTPEMAITISSAEKGHIRIEARKQDQTLDIKHDLGKITQSDQLVQADKLAYHARRSELHGDLKQTGSDVYPSSEFAAGGKEIEITQTAGCGGWCGGCEFMPPYI